MDFDKFIEALTEKEELHLYTLLKKKVDWRVKVCTLDNFILMTNLKAQTRTLLRTYQRDRLAANNNESMLLSEVNIEQLMKYSPAAIKTFIDFIHQRDIFLSNYF